MDQTIFESISYSAGCQECGAELECWGVQALVHGSVRWDTESKCSTCGFAIADCGGDLPPELGGRLLSERGPARLQVGPSATNTAIMRVLRAELAIGVAEVKTLLRKVLAGAHSDTRPEMEFLARKLRAAGVG